MPQRINAEQARQKLSKDEAVLVCAYNDTEKCRNFGIDESTPYPEFKERMDSIPQSKDIIFFCA